MKKLLLTAAALACAMAVTVNAAEKKKGPELSEEGKKVMKEMVEKYDINKDGKLDQEERAKISDEDKAKMKAAGIPEMGKKKAK